MVGESQHAHKQISGRVAQTFQPKCAIEEIHEFEMIKNWLTFIVKNPTPKVYKLVRTIPQWSNNGAP